MPTTTKTRWRAEVNFGPDKDGSETKAGDLLPVSYKPTKAQLERGSVSKAKGTK